MDVTRGHERRGSPQQMNTNQPWHQRTMVQSLSFIYLGFLFICEMCVFFGWGVGEMRGFNVRRCVATLIFPCSSVWGGRGEQIVYYHVNAGVGQIEAQPLGGRLNLMASNYTRVCKVLRVMSTQNRPVSSGWASPADTVLLQQSRAA